MGRRLGSIVLGIILVILAGCSESFLDEIKKKIEDDRVGGTATTTYTVTFDKNDTGAAGTMAAQSIVSGSSANLTACGFTKTDRPFAGWAETPDGAVVYADGASYTMGTADVTLYAKWTWETYNLRDTGPAGGLIFYINPDADTDGWKYLEAAPVSTEWGTKEWSNDSSLIGGTGTAIGDGINNTAIVADWLDGKSETDRAAQVCRDLTVGGYSDWFLPSKDELNEMYVNLKIYGVGGFTGLDYWSSSEYSAANAWAQYFGNGAQNNYTKFTVTYARAVRAF